jgi:hypothetical protein
MIIILHMYNCKKYCFIFYNFYCFYYNTIQCKTINKNLLITYLMKLEIIILGLLF